MQYQDNLSKNKSVIVLVLENDFFLQYIFLNKKLAKNKTNEASDTIKLTL